MTTTGYRAIYGRIIHDPRFRALSTPARAVLLILKLRLGPSGIDRVWRDELKAITGLAKDRELDAVLKELTAREWLEHQDEVYWLRNGWKHEPNRNTPNVAKAVQRHVEALRHPLAKAWAKVYAIPSAKGSGRDTPYQVNVGKREEGRRKKEEGTGRRKTANRAAGGGEGRARARDNGPAAHVSQSTQENSNSGKLTRAQMDRLKAGIIGDMPPATDPMKAAEVDAEVRRQKAMAARALKEQAP